jgi:hypothetical protein
MSDAKQENYVSVEQVLKRTKEELLPDFENGFITKMTLVFYEALQKYAKEENENREKAMHTALVPVLQELSNLKAQINQNNNNIKDKVNQLEFNELRKNVYEFRKEIMAEIKGKVDWKILVIVGGIVSFFSNGILDLLIK